MTHGTTRLRDSAGCRPAGPPASTSFVGRLAGHTHRPAALPDAIGALSELRQLDLRGNPLRDLPASLAALPRLEKLDLRWVESLPPLPWMANLEARGCVIYR